MKHALPALALAIVAASTYTAAGLVGARAGLYHAFRTATPGAFLVIASDLNEELNGLPGEIATQLRDGLPAELRPFAVDERIVRAEYAAPGSTDVKDVLVRGTEARALALHDAAVTSGRFPNPGERAVVVPEHRAAMVQNGRVHFAAAWWPVVGTLRASGAHESELWCDRSALLAALHDEPAGVLFFRPPRESDAAALGALVAQHKDDLDDTVVAPERDVYQAALRTALRYRPLWMLVTALVFLVAAAIAATTAIAHAIGASPKRASMIAFGGGVLGGALACIARATHAEDTIAMLYSTPRTPVVLATIATVVVLVSVVVAFAVRLSRSPSTADAR